MRNTFRQTASKWFPGALLLVLALIFLHKLLSLEFITIGHVEDHLRMFYPYRTYDAEKLRALTIPLWNPYTFGGFPYLASLRCLMFYPLNLIFLFLPTYLGMNVNYILEIFLSGLFMYGLGRTLRLDTYSSLVSAVSFMFCGFLIDKVSWGHLNMLDSSCWLPLVLLLFLASVEKNKVGYSVLAGIVFAIQLFSCHPQLPYYGILTLSFYALYSFILDMTKKRPLKDAIRPSVFLLVLVFVGIGLASVQLIPAAELSTHSLRTMLDDRFAFYTRWSMEFSYLATFLLPRLSPVLGANSFPFPVSLGYIGLLPCLLALVSFANAGREKYVGFFWSVTLLALVLAAGRYTPLYGFFYKYLPGFDAFRNPVFFLYIYVFSMSLLAGFGMAYLQQTSDWRETRTLRIVILSAVSICVLFLSIAAMVYFSPAAKSLAANGLQSLPGDSGTIHAGLLSRLQVLAEKYRITFIYDFAMVAFSLGMATVAVALWNRLGEKNSFSKILIVSAIFLELFIYGKNFIQVYPLGPFVSKGDWVDYLKEDKELYRVLPMLPYPEQDPVLKLNGIASINGYGSLEILQDYVDFVGAFQEQPVHQDACLTRVTNYNSPAVNLMNTKYILTNNTIRHDGFQRVFTDEIPAARTWDPFNRNHETIYIYKNNNVLPRAFVVHSVKVISNRDEILEALKEPTFVPQATIILEEEPGEDFINGVSPTKADEVSFLRYEENEMTLKVSLVDKGFLFFSEIYYPGWKAFVDGKESKIYRADYLFRSLLLDKGVHTVTLVFKPLAFRIGASITMATLTILFSFLMVYLYKKRSHG